MFTPLNSFRWSRARVISFENKYKNAKTERGPGAASGPAMRRAARPHVRYQSYGTRGVFVTLCRTRHR